MTSATPKLKPLSLGGIEAALERVERYRLLNEPSQAESICLDILDLDHENQKALVLLLLAITDSFSHGSATPGAPRALALLPRLSGDYERAYYEGLIHERSARALVSRGGPGAGYGAHAALMRAMKCFEHAESLRPAGNDDSILRYNSCVRLLDSNSSIREAPKPDPSDLIE